MAVNVSAVLVLVVLTVSVVMTSAEWKCDRNGVSGADEESVRDCQRALWFDTATGKCAKVDLTQSSGTLGVITLVDDISECTVFIIIPLGLELFLAFKDGAAFKSLEFTFNDIFVGDVVYSIQLYDGTELQNASFANTTTLTFRYQARFCFCSLNDGSIGSSNYEIPPSYQFCTDTDKCGQRWRFAPIDQICGTPPDLENGDKAADCIYEGCTTTYLCDDQYEIEGDATSQCVDGAWSSSRTCVPRDPCNDNPCQNGGTCENVGGVAVCTCSKGVTGTNCETDCNVAVDKDCQKKRWRPRQIAACNRRTCLRKYRCDPDLDEPCGQNGQCIEDNGVFKCDCSASFTGVKCQIDIRECVAKKEVDFQNSCNVMAERCQERENKKKNARRGKWKPQPDCDKKKQKCLAMVNENAVKKCKNSRCYKNQQRWRRFGKRKYGWENVQNHCKYWPLVRWAVRSRC